MGMTHWLRVKEPPEGADVHLDLLTSPYDVPCAVRGRPIDGGKFRIEFQYIDGEEHEGKARRLDEHFLIFEGKHSKRLMAIEIDTESLGASSVGFSITRADGIKQRLNAAVKRIKEFSGSVPNSTRAVRAIEDREAELLQMLT